MARDTIRGLHVWDLSTDQFSHDALAQNWDRLETLISQGTQSAEIVSVVPSTGNFAGRLVMLNVANGGFPAWTLLRFDGGNWRAIGPFEILPAIPTQGNFAGRVIVLSAGDGGFAAWDIIRYTGSTWGIVGGWQTVSTGALATNINGVQTPNDLLLASGTHGLVLTDRSTGQTRRFYLNNGLLQSELVT